MNFKHRAPLHETYDYHGVRINPWEVLGNALVLLGIVAAGILGDFIIAIAVIAILEMIF